MKKIINYLTSSLLVISIVLPILEIFINDGRPGRVYQLDTTWYIIAGTLLVWVINKYLSKEGLMRNLFTGFFFFTIILGFIVFSYAMYSLSVTAGLGLLKATLVFYGLTIISGVIGLIRK